MSATASDQSDRGFAYTLLVCPAMDQAELGQHNYREILDAFVDLETSQAAEGSMWPFGWRVQMMRRVAPVQYSGVHDLRHELLRFLGSPRWRFDHPAVYGGSVMYFPALSLPRPPKSDAAVSVEDNHKDHERFLAVLSASLEAAARFERGLLFVGGWGWDYGREIPPEQQVALMEAGYPFVDRRVP